MKKADVKVGGVYWARISGKLTKVRLDQEIERRGYGPRAKTMTGYAATNLGTGRKITIKSAAKLRKAAFPEGSARKEDEAFVGATSAQKGVFNMGPKKGEEHADVGLETTFMAVGPGFWGRGDTESAAVLECRRAGATKGDRMVLYRNVRARGQAKPYVDEAGNTVYYGTLEKVATVESDGKRVAHDPNAD